MMDFETFYRKLIRSLKSGEGWTIDETVTRLVHSRTGLVIRHLGEEVAAEDKQSVYIKNSAVRVCQVPVRLVDQLFYKLVEGRRLRAVETFLSKLEDF